MWNYNNIITMELGSKIISATSSPDPRSLFEKVYKAPPQADVRLLITKIGEIRQELAGQNIFLPTLVITDNSNLEQNAVICYWGVVPSYFKVHDIDELYDFIKSKAYEFNSKDWSKQYVKSLLISSVECLKQNDVQTAYENYQKAYYIARIQGYNYECAQALSEISGILATSGETQLATSYAEAAITLSKDANIVDSALKSQVRLNCASILLAQNDIKSAFNIYRSCANISRSSGNTAFYLFSQLGMAECLAMNGQIMEAIETYKVALSLINRNSPKEQAITNAIYAEMVNLYDLLLKFQRCTILEQQKYDIRNYFGSVIMTIAGELIKKTLDYAVYKVLNIDGAIALFSFGTKYEVKGNLFNGPTAIGNNSTSF